MMSKNIFDYDPNWPALFALEAHRLRTELHGVAFRIDHVGSTAVPGLAAKPVIDILVIADTLCTEECWTRLVSLGYTHREVPFAFFHQPQEWPHTHHVHVREAGSPDERRWLLFRDWLRSHPADRRAYETLKRDLADGADLRRHEDRMRYSEAKTDFVRSIECLATGARKYGVPQGSD
jgi:GrpB-like predicted nucleotidyltransferase (UPF0157 family)